MKPSRYDRWTWGDDLTIGIVGILLGCFFFALGICRAILAACRALGRGFEELAEYLAAVFAGCLIGVPLWLWDAAGHLQAWAGV